MLGKPSCKASTGAWQLQLSQPLALGSMLLLGTELSPSGNAGLRRGRAEASGESGRDPSRPAGDSGFLQAAFRPDSWSLPLFLALLREKGRTTARPSGPLGLPRPPPTPPFLHRLDPSGGPAASPAGGLVGVGRRLSWGKGGLAVGTERAERPPLPGAAKGRRRWRVPVPPAPLPRGARPAHQLLSGGASSPSAIAVDVPPRLAVSHDGKRSCRKTNPSPHLSYGAPEPLRTGP